MIIITAVSSTNSLAHSNYPIVDLDIVNVMGQKHLDYYWHRGSHSGLAKAHGPAAKLDHDYILRGTCAAEHALKCNYNVDLVTPNGTLKTNYLVGAMYNSKETTVSDGVYRRTGSINLIREGEMYPSGKVGNFKIQDGNTYKGQYDRRLEITINLEEGQLHLIASYPRNGDVYSSLKNHIVRVKEYNNLSLDESGRVVGGLTKIVRKKRDNAMYIQSIRCMPNKRFGQWCTMSFFKLGLYQIQLETEFGRIEGEKIFNDGKGRAIIPWRIFDTHGRNLPVKNVYDYKKYSMSGHTIVDGDSIKYVINHRNNEQTKEEFYSEFYHEEK